MFQFKYLWKIIPWYFANDVLFHSFQKLCLHFGRVWNPKIWAFRSAGYIADFARADPISSLLSTTRFSLLDATSSRNRTSSLKMLKQYPIPLSWLCHVALWSEAATVASQNTLKRQQASWEIEDKLNWCRWKIRNWSELIWGLELDWCLGLKELICLLLEKET